MNEKLITSDDLAKMDTQPRAAFMNSLTGFKSASLIGTIDQQRQTNLAIFSSVVHLGSNPALVGFISRPHTTERHTLENIQDTGCFTVNHVNEHIYRQAHQTAARYPKCISEFEATGLTPRFSQTMKAPYVQESHIKYGVEYVEKHALNINGTILVIGRVVEVLIPESSVMADGTIDIEMFGTIAISGLDGYHSTTRLSRLSYAKTNTLPTELN